MPETALIIFVSLAIFIVLIVLFNIIGISLFRRNVRREVDVIFRHGKKTDQGVVTEEEVTRLPVPVQRWLRYSQIIGKGKARCVRLKQKGIFRQKENQKWVHFRAEGYYTTDFPAFLWYASIKPLFFLSVQCRDRCYEGKGHIFIKLIPFLTVVNATGNEINQGTLIRYLDEIMWFPTAALSEYIKWEAVDSHSSRATINFQGVTASATFHFNEKGQITTVVADRYRESNGEYSLEKWSTPVLEYGEIQGIRIPTKCEAMWNLNSGDFPYIRGELTEIEFNVPLAY